MYIIDVIEINIPNESSAVVEFSFSLLIDATDLILLENKESNFKCSRFHNIQLYLFQSVQNVMAVFLKQSLVCLWTMKLTSHSFYCGKECGLRPEWSLYVPPWQPASPSSYTWEGPSRQRGLWFTEVLIPL